MRSKVIIMDDTMEQLSNAGIKHDKKILLYGVILSNLNQDMSCTLTDEEIFRFVRVSERNLKRCLKALQDKDFIRIEKDSETAARKIYPLVFPAEMEDFREVYEY